MNRLVLLAAALAAVATAAPVGGLALARDGDQGRRAESSERSPDRARAWQRERGGRERPGRRWREEDRRRFDDRRSYEDRRRGPDERSPRTYREPRRGGYLPDAYRGGLVQDYPRYRLRTPPQGYAWVRIGGGFALVSLEDGRIYDMVQ